MTMADVTMRERVTGFRLACSHNLDVTASSPFHGEGDRVAVEGFLTHEGSVSRARILRRTLTPPEARLWVHLRRRALDGLKFRRQHPAGVYVLDFYCAEAMLAVEVDGESHADRFEHDARRTRWLERQGIAVVRFSAESVRVNLGAVLDIIADRARERIRS